MGDKTSNLLPPSPRDPVLGSRGIFLSMLGVLAATSLIWPWMRIVREDLAAGAAFLAAGPMLLTWGDRRESWRKVFSALLFLGSMTCLIGCVPGGESFLQADLEVLILVGLGAACASGAVYLGLWGEHWEEALWARMLAPLGGLLIAVAAVALAAPESDAGLSATLRVEGGRAWRVWVETGGLWRWGGLGALVLVVMGVSGGRRKPDTREQGRYLNWNR